MTPDERAAMERLQADNYTPSDDYVETPHAKYRDLHIVYDAFLRDHPEGEEEVVSFQNRVQPWMMACFGEQISRDHVKRADRLLEELFELLQSGGYDPARVLALRDYVWNRPAGEPSQEVGGVMVTLAAYCLAHDLDMHDAGETELARIWTKVEVIRAKQAAKPTGSALPVAIEQTAPCTIRQQAAEIEALRKVNSTSGGAKMIQFNPDAWVCVHLRPDSNVVQVTSNIANETVAKRYADAITSSGGCVLRTCSAGVLVAALELIKLAVEVDDAR